MQDAYFQEKGEVGKWMEIGYSAPGVGASFSYASNVFDYSPDGSGTADATNWYAKAKSKLNDCPATTGQWSLKAENVGSAGAYTGFTIKDNNTTPNCKLLTASWDNLTRN